MRVQAKLIWTNLILNSIYFNSVSKVYFPTCCPSFCLHKFSNSYISLWHVSCLIRGPTLHLNIWSSCGLESGFRFTNCEECWWHVLKWISNPSLVKYLKGSHYKFLRQELTNPLIQQKSCFYDKWDSTEFNVHCSQVYENLPICLYPNF